MEDLHGELEAIFRDVLADPSLVLTDEFSAEQRPDWDSVATINLMFAIEERFGIAFHGSEFTDLRSVGELKSLLARRLPTFEQTLRRGLQGGSP